MAQSRLCVERNSREVLRSVGVALAPVLSIGHRSQRGENSCHDYMSSSVVSEKGRIQYQSLECKLGLPVCTTSDHIPSCFTDSGYPWGAPVAAIAGIWPKVQACLSIFWDLTCSEVSYTLQPGLYVVYECVYLFVLQVLKKHPLQIILEARMLP